MVWVLVCRLPRVPTASACCLNGQVFEHCEKTQLTLPWLVFRMQWLAALLSVRVRLLEKPVKILSWDIWLEKFKPKAVN